MIRNLLFLYWDSCFCCVDLLEALADFRDKYGGLEVVIADIEDPDSIAFDKMHSILADFSKTSAMDSVFSFGFYPSVSMYCEENNILYISWIFDNPVVNLYHKSVMNKINRLFLFDSQMTEEMKAQGVKHAYYLPMAVNPRRLSGFIPNDEIHRRYDSDVSFVGNMYTERYCYYDEMYNKLDEYTKGFLRGILASQGKIYGDVFFERLLNNVVKKMYAAYPLNIDADFNVDQKWVYANYVLCRKLTSLERSGIIKELARYDEIDLYTEDKAFGAEGIRNHGPVDYFHEMPYVFKCSKINLNITLRSIQKGIPLRAFDIMGCGGFLLSNYQEDMLAFFKPDEDFVFWDDIDQIPELVKYYIRNEKERKEIADNSYKKVIESHTFFNRLERIMETV